MEDAMSLNKDDFRLGAFSFGGVIGWVTATTLNHITAHGIADIAAVGAAIGGAAVSQVITKDEQAFGNYCLGLAGAFFVRVFILYLHARGIYCP
jgi:hypothetical protein